MPNLDPRSVAESPEDVQVNLQCWREQLLSSPKFTAQFLRPRTTPQDAKSPIRECRCTSTTLWSPPCRLMGAFGQVMR